MAYLLDGHLTVHASCAHRGRDFSLIRGNENFESPLFFGSPAGIRVITTDIYDAINQSSPPRYQYATSVSFVIMTLLFLIVLLQWKLLKGRSFTTVSGKGYSPASSSSERGAGSPLRFASCFSS